jgi:hypothetical protein
MREDKNSRRSGGIAGRKIKSVYETGTEFKIEFQDGSSTTLQLADPGSSVAVRDRNNAVEYLG